MRIRLGEDNRKLLGVDLDELTVDLADLYQSEAEALNDAIGLDPDRWVAFLRRGEDTGEVDEDGRPIRVHDPVVLRVIVWLALRRNGHRMSLGEVDFNRRTLDVLPDASEPEDQGKGPEGQGSFAASESPTPPTSSESSPA